MNRWDALAVLGVAAVAVGAAFERTPEADPVPVPEPAPQAATVRPPPAVCEPLKIEMPELMHAPVDRPIPDIENGQRLDPFFEKLARLVRGKARDHLRIGVYADSNGTKDFMTGRMRRVLQGKYGDAGHGWIAMGKPWDWYLHRDVKQGLDHSAWRSFVVSSRPAPDPYYGHGLIAAETRLRGAVTWIATADERASIGKTVSRAELYYLKRPAGGTFHVEIDGKRAASILTASDTYEPGYRVFEMPDAPHKIAVVAEGDGLVRILGLTLERGTPSVIVDALSVGAASWRTMIREDPDFDTATLRHRGYDLMILHMGTNTWKAEPRRAQTMRQVMQHLHEAIPETPLLVMTPPDHADDWKVMAEEIPPEQRKIAAEMGAAFFDFHAAMGGAHSMQRFYHHGLAWDDVVHFTEQGGAYMGDRVLHAMWRELARYVGEHPRAGCDDAARPL